MKWGIGPIWERDQYGKGINMGIWECKWVKIRKGLTGCGDKIYRITKRTYWLKWNLKIIANPYFSSLNPLIFRLPSILVQQHKPNPSSIPSKAVKIKQTSSNWSLDCQYRRLLFILLLIYYLFSVRVWNPIYSFDNP